MKILHTSDWHFGKKLEGQSRIEEQKKFIETLNIIVKNENIDLILLAGDIYDTYNPPAEAERLFFNSIKLLSNNGKVGIIIIPGNHDNPKRLSSVSALAEDYGVIIYEKAFQTIPIGQYGSLKIIHSDEGGILVEQNNKKAYIYNLPFPSEATLNEDFQNIKFHERISEILHNGIEKNTFNVPSIIMTHIYVSGSMGEGDEYLELGGARAISIDDLPNVNYIALGHVHKPLAFKSKNAYYCGSPIEYRITENKFEKKVFVVNITKEESIVKNIPLDNFKPIKEYIVNGAQEAIEKSIELEKINEWIYLKINLEEPLTNSQLRKIKKNKNILEIIPLIKEIDVKNKENINYTEENIQEAFIEFFKEENKGLEPNSEIKNMFFNLLEEGDNIETN